MNNSSKNIPEYEKYRHEQIIEKFLIKGYIIYNNINTIEGNNMSLSDPNIERLIAAFKRKKHDRVPHFEIVIDPKMTQSILGLQGKKEDPDKIINSLTITPEEKIELAKKTSQDAIVIDLTWAFFNTKENVAGTICSEEDIDRFDYPDLAEYRKNLIEHIEKTKGTNIGVCVFIFMPFFVTFYLMGPIPIQSFMMNLIDNLEFVERVMDIHLEQQMRIFESIMDLPFSFIYVGDDICGSNGLLASPGLMEKIWVSRYKKFMKLLRKPKVPIEFHCCGKLDWLMPYLVEEKVDAVHPIQPSCNDIYALKKQYGNDLSFNGNMNIEGALAFGSKEEVIEDTKEHIERLSYNGGYIAASSHSIVDAIPKDNYFAMIDAIIRYGSF